MPKKILLADDSVTIQKVISITFASEDYELIIVGDGNSALDKAREAKPDLIMADVSMPGKNGYEVCEAVKNDPDLSGVPVLLLAGTFETLDDELAAKVGADDSIVKPFESQELIEKVRAMLAASEPAAGSADEGVEAPAVESAWEAGDFLGAPEDEAEAPEFGGEAPDLDFLDKGGLFDEPLDASAAGDEFGDIGDIGAGPAEGDQSVGEPEATPSAPSEPLPPAQEEEPVSAPDEPAEPAGFETPDLGPFEPASVDFGREDRGLAESEASSDAPFWEESPAEPAPEPEEAPAAVPPAEEAAPEAPDLTEGPDELGALAGPAPEAAEESDAVEAPQLSEPLGAPELLDEHLKEAEEFGAYESSEPSEPAPADEPIEEAPAEEAAPEEPVSTEPVVEAAPLEEAEPVEADLPPILDEGVAGRVAEDAGERVADAIAEKIGDINLSKEHLEEIVSKVAREVIEEIAWEVVPELAEELIKAEINRFKETIGKGG